MIWTGTLARQFLKYLSVGCVSNVAAYCFYLIIVAIGFAPLVSMTLVYVFACFGSFFVNKSWTFKSTRRLRAPLLKFVVVQLIGYATSFVLLLVLHHQLGIHHYVVQLIGMLIVAIELFLLCRYYVFA